MIYEEISKSKFLQMFKKSDRKDQFTRPALSKLYDYLIELTEGIDEDLEMDIIALCCEWTEYDDDELVNTYGEFANVDDDTDDEEKLPLTMEYLEANTTILEVEGGSYLVMEF